MAFVSLLYLGVDALGVVGILGEAGCESACLPWHLTMPTQDFAVAGETCFFLLF